MRGLMEQQLQFGGTSWSKIRNKTASVTAHTLSRVFSFNKRLLEIIPVTFFRHLPNLGKIVRSGRRGQRKEQSVEGCESNQESTREIGMSSGGKGAGA